MRVVEAGRSVHARMVTATAAAAAGLLVAAAALVGVVAPAHAVPDPGNPVGSGPGGIDSELTVTDMIDTGGVFGGIDPAVDVLAPYPSTTPSVPLVPETTAQLVLSDIQDQTGTVQGLAYCIDLNTDTTIGVNYGLGDWTEANVPNLVYVDYILTHYFPNVPAAPAGTRAEKVAAVQAAIWFFTDRFVLAAVDPAHAATAAIVADAQANAGGSAPVLPTLTVTPATAQVPTTGELVGPFTVGGTAATSTLTQQGVQVYADAAGTQPLADGATIPAGSQVWMRYVSTTTPEGFRLSTVQPVVQGNVFLYDGTNPGRTTAQKLILAAPTVLPIRAGVTAVPLATGAVQVTKTIAGRAAGLQGAVTVTALCSDGATTATYTTSLAAGAASGSHALPVMSGIPAGMTCALSETQTGGNADAVVASSSLTPATVTIGDRVTAAVAAANSYDPPTPPVPPVPPAPPGPTPTPSPTPAVAGGGDLAATGAGGEWPVGLAGLLLVASGVVGLLVAARRRRAAR